MKKYYIKPEIKFEEFYGTMSSQFESYGRGESVGDDDFD